MRITYTRLFAIIALVIFLGGVTAPVVAGIQDNISGGNFLAQNTNPTPNTVPDLGECFGNIMDITDITIDDLVSCMHYLKAIGDEIIAWFLALLSEIIDYAMSENQSNQGY